MKSGVHSQGATSHLVDAYPLAVPASRRSDWYEATGQHLNWYLPDWATVAVDYDAVHLTVLGYLTTPGLAIPLTAHPGASVLAGWDPDATFWLDPRLVRVGGRPVEWSRTRDAPWAPRPAR
ncbi:hypothetical protein [Rhodococcus zopfii]|uniref:hypothetical protein n=1 Tax=Rhodococcus zopfii TaxID=43772 RepID=UPI001EE0E00B|nr:hypothetical protein [Rhodococcus zopfii]